MKIFRPFIISLAITLMYVVSTNAQTEKSQTVNSGKIAVINFESLKDEKIGIKEFADVDKKLEIEFKHPEEELKTLNEKRQNSIKELQKLEKSIEIRVTQEVLDSKVREYEFVNCRYKTKLAEVKSLFDKRKLEIFADLNKKIVEALKQFAKNKGYDLIINNVAIEKGIITNIENDVTEEFIKFYNNQTEKK